MAIYTPSPVYTEVDKRVLILITKLLLESHDSGVRSSNLPSGILGLTDKEADELIANLQKLVDSREFLEKCYFVEGLTLQDGMEESKIREIYLSVRKRRGRSRAMASTHWANFKSRFGMPERFGPVPQA